MDIGKDKAVAKIISRLKAAIQSKGQVKVEGSWGSFAPLLAAYISKELKIPILYIRPHIDAADKAADDLQTFGAKNVEPLPAWEDEEQIIDATDEIRAQRLKLILKLLNNQDFLIPASIQAICQPVPKKNAIQSASLKLSVNKQLSPENIIQWLVDNNFENVDKIDLPGQFARRGGIIDIFAPVAANLTFTEKSKLQDFTKTEAAVRIEFFADNIESIRIINLDTQRSLEQIEAIDIISAASGAGQKDKELFINLLPPQTLIILDEPTEIEEVAGLYIARVENPSQLHKWQDIYTAVQNFTRLHICRFAASDEDFIKLNIKSTQPYQHKAAGAWATHKAALEKLIDEAKQAKKVYLYCESSAEIQRVGEIVKQTSKKLPANFNLLKGFIHQGFVISSLNAIVISHHELFGQFALRRLQRPMRPSAPIDTLADLMPGDYVVHASYGIGRFTGVETIKQKSGTSEHLTIKYADDIKVHVSVSNINLIQKYIGTSPKRPNLSKIGSKKWQKQKSKVAKAIQDLAVELLEVQAKRQLAGGFALPADSNWQREFEESFPYQETPDQFTAAEDIKNDMQQPVAMDRLLCGDVGYGKTELAMRAAFKTVENNKQVAVLVPTTVLCVQHGRTFTERFADFPVCIEILNRFKTSKQTADIIKRTKEGKVDILIGTHRLLSGDVGFKNLGLLIIDEEQRFGVRQKEKLKKMRVNVDILTMTATPIPRTLHMSLLGLRDISSLVTPPLDRRSIVTSVTGYNKELIKKAVIREINRSGQVFFLHNRVKTIDKKAFEISKLLEQTKAQIATAHGRMHKEQLEKTMIDFVEGKIDVLVCTTIIESGLDIPNANTIFIDNADRFGLAELHQLRGRVGRYKHKAFAYMLLPPKRTITPLASRRLKAIEDYSHLGAGFRIALRDLEIRGAGNILGAAQSGHIQLIGYQMYCELLAAAVRKLKNQPEEKIPVAVLDIGITTYIPKNYIPSDRHRMEAYRKIAVAKTIQQIKDLAAELNDLYGPVPDEVKLLLDLTELKIKAAQLDIKAIIASGKSLVFSFARAISNKDKLLFKNVAGKLIISDDKTIYLHLPKNYLEPQTLINILRKILAVPDKKIKEKQLCYKE